MSQCSTLMLIESAKDSLSFSVTHYKHPKQPHTVQVRRRTNFSLTASILSSPSLLHHHLLLIFLLFLTISPYTPPPEEAFRCSPSTYTLPFSIASSTFLLFLLLLLLHPFLSSFTLPHSPLMPPVTPHPLPAGQDSGGEKAVGSSHQAVDLGKPPGHHSTEG